FQASRYSRATSAGLVMGLLLSLLKAPVNAEIITPASTEVTDPGNSIHPEGVGGSPVVVTVIVIVGEGVEAGHALDLEDGTVPGVIRVDIGRGHPATPWHEGGGASEENPWVAGITVLLTAVQHHSGRSQRCPAGRLDPGRAGGLPRARDEDGRSSDHDPGHSSPRHGAEQRHRRWDERECPKAVRLGRQVPDPRWPQRDQSLQGERYTCREPDRLQLPHRAERRRQ